MLLSVSETLVKQSETSETISNDQHLKVSKHLKATSILMLQLLQVVTKMLQPQSHIHSNVTNVTKKTMYLLYIYYIIFFIIIILFSYFPIGKYKKSCNICNNLLPD